MARGARFALLALLAVAALVPPAAGVAAPEEKPIQPGAQIRGPAGCTFNFVFRDDAGALYIGTAGHCADPGSVVLDGGRRRVGTVVFYPYRGGATSDFALIRIDEERYPDVSPALRVWGGPTGHATQAETTLGDPVLHHGYGMVFGSSAVTRPRPAVLWDSWEGQFWSQSPVIFGDSGGPVLHAPTGKALGIVSRLGGGAATHTGPTVENVLRLAAAAGWDLEVVTAPYDEPGL